MTRGANRKGLQYEPGIGEVKRSEFFGCFNIIYAIRAIRLAAEKTAHASCAAGGEDQAGAAQRVSQRA